ncbi:hypothetical protein [Flyfo microvirus Tbat2_93]|nr:hypothetical protein [Flyfo microvirus Tbat2_93]
MKFDPYSWNEVKTNVEIPQAKGRLQLRLSQACPLYITAQGVEALAGVSAEHDWEVSEEVTFRVDAPKGVRAFLFTPLPTSAQADPAGWTNIDRMPHESGAVAEVSKARRLLEMERRSMLSEIRREAAIARASIKGATEKAEKANKARKAEPEEGLAEGDANVAPEAALEAAAEGGDE